jgi:hypothetical protein
MVDSMVAPRAAQTADQMAEPMVVQMAGRWVV